MARSVALLYARVSLVQDGRETSPAVQIERCYRLAQERGRTVNLETDVYMDADKGQHSAFTRENVPSWEKLEQRALSDPTVADIIVDGVDRAYRNVRELLNFETQIKSLGVKLVFVDSGEVETDSPTGMLQFTMRGVLAEMHARDTSYRIKTRHYAPLRARGLYLGHGAPPGLKRVGHRFDVKLVAGENLPIIVAFLELYLADHGTPSAAQELEKRGLIPRGHWQRWRVTFRRLFAKLEKGYYDGILDDALIARALAEHERRSKQQRRVRKPRRYPIPVLWQLLVCGTCGRRYSTGAVKYPRDERVYLNYEHQPGACPAPRGISARKVVRLLKPWLAKLRAIPLEDLEEAAQRMAAPPAADRTDADIQIRKLEQRLAGLDVMKADGDISRERYLELKAQTEQELSELNAQRQPVATGPQWTYEGARLFLQHLIDTDFAELVESDPEAANRLLRVFLDKVELDSSKRLHFVMRPEFAWLDPAPPVAAPV